MKVCIVSIRHLEGGGDVLAVFVGIENYEEAIVTAQNAKRNHFSRDDKFRVDVWNAQTQKVEATEYV